MARLKIITGHYGSGKTEFVLNYAYELRKSTGCKVYIVDVDVINVYFRSREKVDELKESGIEVLGSNQVRALGSDLPAVDFSFISKYKVETDAYFILDLAGSKNGLNICKTILDRIDDYDLIMVLNTYRSETSDCSKIIEQIRSFEAFSTLEVTYLVNNTNLLNETKYVDLVSGYNVLLSVSGKLKIPIMKSLVYKPLLLDANLSLLGGEDKILAFESLKIREKWL